MSVNREIAIIGFGLMGAQIAQVFALSGYRVSAYDSNKGQLDSGYELIKKGKYGLENSVRKGRITEADHEESLKRISKCDSIERACTDADLVLEAAFEDLTVKRAIFQKASTVAKEGSIFASNTSTISLTKIAESRSPDFKARFAGLHFFNPPQVMKLVEIVRTKETSEDVISSLRKIVISISKTAIVAYDSPGFVANRIGLAVFAEASSLLEKKIASVRDIDLAMRLGYGYPMGPFELGDLVGLNSRLRNMRAMHDETGDERFKPPEILEKLVSEGYLGDPKLKKGSRGGYYEYYGLQRPGEGTGEA